MLQRVRVVASSIGRYAAPGRIQSSRAVHSCLQRNLIRPGQLFSRRGFEFGLPWQRVGTFNPLTRSMGSYGVDMLKDFKAPDGRYRFMSINDTFYKVNILSNYHNQGIDRRKISVPGRLLWCANDMPAICHTKEFSSIYKFDCTFFLSWEVEGWNHKIRTGTKAFCLSW